MGGQLCLAEPLPLPEFGDSPADLDKQCITSHPLHHRRWREFSALSILDGMKSEIYNAHAGLNWGFDMALESLRLLQEQGVLTVQFVHDHTIMVEELKAGINRKIHEVLNDTELEGWTRFGKLRLEIEARNRGKAGNGK